MLYDDNASLLATRLWWVFSLYGHTNVRIVDGGFNAWLDEGWPLTSQPASLEPGNFTARVDDSHLCSIDELKTHLEGDNAIQIWDTRSDMEWSGGEHPFSSANRRTGHIPGATHLEWLRLMDDTPARRFRPLSEIRQLLIDAGINPETETVTYYQAGNRAAFAAFILRLLGNDSARNYEGSMGEWANRDDTPLTID